MTGRVLQAFTAEETLRVEQGLRDLCAQLQHVPGGGKVEEDYWAKVYRNAKGIHGEDGWSNLPFQDFINSGRGVEWKLLKRDSPTADQGKSLMHPAATRTISYDPSKAAEECKKVILKQWAATISDFRERVRRTAADKRSADIRWGVLLWAPTLEEFLYFEEELLEPDPAAFKAEWVEGNHRGNATRNLYIYERATGAKRYSITLPEKGAKIQPYFDVPTVANGAHHFKISRVDTRPLIVQQKTYDEVAKAAAGAGLGHDLFVREMLATYQASPKKRG